MKSVREQIRELLDRLLGLFASSREEASSKHTAPAAPPLPPSTTDPTNMATENLPADPPPTDKAPSCSPAEPERPVESAADILLTETGLSTHMLHPEDSENWQATQTLLAELRELMETEYCGEKAKEGRPAKRKSGRPREGDAGQLPPIEARVKSVGALFSEMTKKPKTEMVVLITYDITSNKIRKKVSDFLEGMGFERIQKSVFLGQIDKRSFREIQETVYALQQSYDNEDSIVLLPVSESELMGMRMVGKEIDMSFALKRQNTLFF